MSCDNDEVCGIKTIACVVLLIVSAILGVCLYNTSNALEAEKTNVANLTRSMAAARDNVARMAERARGPGAAIEALDPATVATMEKAVAGDVSAMSIAEAVKLRNMIDTRLNALIETKAKFEKAFRQVLPATEHD
jgi:hypothetical protein